MQKKGTVPNRSLANAVQKIKYLSMLLRANSDRCSGLGKNGCKTCKAAAVECVFPESQKRGYFRVIAQLTVRPHKGYFETISTVRIIPEKLMSSGCPG